jgi:hypothetical protein
MRKTNLKVIYSCYWGSYLAVVAASLHLGFIGNDKFKGNDILTLQLFNNIKDDELGELIFLGIDDKIGSIEPMKSADVILSNKNPLENISSLGDSNNISLVVQDGNVIKNTL